MFLRYRSLQAKPHRRRWPGIEPGDVLHAINGVTIENYEQTSDLILGASGEEMTVTVERDGVLVDLTVARFLQ